MRARVLGVTLLVAALPACDPSATEVLRATAARLPDIRSGEMHLAASITAPEGARTGFTLDGVFSLPTETGALPEADLSYTQEGDDVVEGRFVSDGDAVFVEVDGERVELPPEEVDALRVSGTEDAPSVFAELAIDDWISDTQLTTQGEVDRVTGTLDVVRAMNELIAIAARFGATSATDLEQLNEASAEQVSNAVASSSIEIATGAEDRLLRELHIRVEFAPPDAELADALGPLDGAIFELDLEVVNPNSGVDVE